MVRDRKPIYNSRGERIFDIIWTDKKIYVETSHKGNIKRITLADETYKIFMALSHNEKERKVTLKADKISEYFAEDCTSEEIEGIIIQLLDEWKKKQ